MHENLSTDGTGSPPARGRGLKPDCAPTQGARVESPPSRGRGLKRLLMLLMILDQQVAPFAGAWIETLPIARSSIQVLGRPLRGGVD